MNLQQQLMKKPENKSDERIEKKIYSRNVIEPYYMSFALTTMAIAFTNIK